MQGHNGLTQICLVQKGLKIINKDMTKLIKSLHKLDMVHKGLKKSHRPAPRNFFMASFAVFVVGTYMNLRMLSMTCVPTRTKRPKLRQSTHRIVIGGQ